jgi:hypothetical protein
MDFAATFNVNVNYRIARVFVIFDEMVWICEAEIAFCWFRSGERSSEKKDVTGTLSYTFLFPNHTPHNFVHYFFVAERV